MSPLPERAVDQAPTADPPRWPRLVVVGGLLPLGILGALALSAAATIALAAAQGVPVEVRPAAVAMLEVVSTAGTLLAIFARTPRLRNRAMAGVVAASIVSLIAGLMAYGLFGVVAPLLLVWLVHLAAEAYQELRAERSTAVSEQVSAPVPAVPDVPVDAPAPPVEPSSDTVEAEPDPFDQQPIGPVHGPLTLVDDLRARPALPSVRSLMAELDCTRHQAHKALTEAKSGLTVVAS